MCEKRSGTTLQDNRIQILQDLIIFSTVLKLLVTCDVMKCQYQKKPVVIQ